MRYVDVTLQDIKKSVIILYNVYYFVNNTNAELFTRSTRAPLYVLVNFVDL